MDSLVGYGSDDEHENDRYAGHHSSGAGRRREDDTNYEEVNMDMSEDSQQESEPELPQAERPGDRGSADSRDRERSRDRRDRRRESPRRDRDRRSPRRDDRSNRSDRPDRNRGFEGSRRGLLGDRPDDRPDKPPALMDLKFGDGAPGAPRGDGARSHDARDAVSPRFVDRDRRDRDRGSRERERDRDNREGRYRDRRDDDRRSREPRDSRESRGSRERPDERPPRARPGAAFPPPSHVAGSSSGYSERRGDGDYKPSSFKVNRKLEVMEKMGLQIKTPDGSMATAQQLRAAAHEPGQPAPLPSYYNPQAPSNKILDQVAKRKLLWAHKKEEKSEAEKAAPWTGTRFASDQDGKQASKFMRLMGIRDPDAVKQEAPEKTVDPIKKQEELFQAMQAQYEVARATTHTMRGVGLGFQRGQY
ncbi:arginine/serine-rich coiled-coil protein 2 isoform X2 [Leguminivora glycinivorella]|uniref:arginine/serine-rich coiled-coil protein 2 isoform X2 n=1 Tax=Leguminivora glycinivorella TaxID=1035111 RepID=UPI00200D58BB|nr:arginine/serine-rich coiled-coil protein 2 isoform X2 [Leguminivora glycinivorella]